MIKIVSACLAVEQAKRPQSASAILVQLEKMMAQYSTSKPEEVVTYFLQTSMKKRVVHFRKRVPAGLIFITTSTVTAMIAALVLMYILQGRHSRRLEAQEAFAAIETGTHGAAVPPAETVDSAALAAQHPERIAPVKKTRPAKAPELKRKEVRSSDVVARLKAGPATETDKSAAGTSAKKPTVVEELVKTYGTADLMSILAAETGKGNFKNSLAVYGELPPEQAASKRALIYKLRALRGMGEQSALRVFLDSDRIDDAEFYLAKAYDRYGRHSYREALDMLDRSAAKQGEFADPEALAREAFYLRAQCLTGLYGTDASEANRTAALEAWFNVKYAFRNNQRHPWFTEANDQIRRMAETGK